MPRISCVGSSGKNLLFFLEPDQWFLTALCIGLPQEVFSEDGKTHQSSTMRRLKHEPIFSASIFQMKKLGLRGGEKSPRAVQGQPASGLPSVELCVIHRDSLLTELLSA